MKQTLLLLLWLFPIIVICEENVNETCYVIFSPSSAYLASCRLLNNNQFIYPDSPELDSTPSIIRNKSDNSNKYAPQNRSMNSRYTLPSHHIKGIKQNNYFGGQLLISDINELKNKSSGARIFAGLKVHDNLSMEIGISSQGEAYGRDDIGNIQRELTVSLSKLDILGVITTPVYKLVSFSTKAGFYSWKGKFVVCRPSSELCSRDIDHGIGFIYGVSGQIQIAKKLNLSLDMNIYTLSLEQDNIYGYIGVIDYGLTTRITF